VGLVETSIGKMVPIMTQADLEQDPLQVFAEPYNNLIVDRLGFKGKVPEVPGLSPKENIKAWVDRKAFIHNLGHAAAAYYGSFKHPNAVYIYEVLSDAEVFGFVKDVMLQSAAIIQRQYPNDFYMEDLEAHVDDLLKRFQNKALKDTVFRVGQDRPRKLGPDDRFVGVIRLAETLGMNVDKIVQAMTYAFRFKATDESGKRSPQDVLFDEYVSEGLEDTLQKVCGFDPMKDNDLISKAVSFLFGVGL
jgi:mannitol-1-phosphate 5-dehydrogenase